MNFNLKKILIQIYSLTILLTFFTSCNGQVETANQAEVPVASAILIQPRASQSIIQDHNGDIWYEDSVGVTVYSPSTNIFKHYTEKDGLSSNKVQSILSQRYNRFSF
jgi:hypothetical protein